MWENGTVITPLIKLLEILMMMWRLELPQRMNVYMGISYLKYSLRNWSIVGYRLNSYHAEQLNQFERNRVSKLIPAPK